MAWQEAKSPGNVNYLIRTCRYAPTLIKPWILSPTIKTGHFAHWKCVMPTETSREVIK